MLPFFPVSPLFISHNKLNYSYPVPAHRARCRRRLYFFLFHCARWMQIPSFMKNRPTTFKPLSLIALVESWRWILALEMRKLDILLPHLLPLLPHQYHQFRRRAPPQKPPFVSITLRTTYVGIHTKTYDTTKTPWKS